MKKCMTETKVAITLTIIILAVILILGLIIIFGVGGELLGKISFNGPDITRIGNVFALFGIFALLLGFIFYLICGAGILLAPIWIIWGIIKLIKKSKSKKQESQNLSENEIIEISSQEVTEKQDEEFKTQE